MKSCFESCTREDCHAGAPCHKPTRRVRAGEAQPSSWAEIEPDLPIEVAEPDKEPIDRTWFAWVLLVCLAFWVAVYFGVVV